MLQVKFNYDVVQTGVGAHGQSEETEQHQEWILEDHEAEGAARVAVPVGEGVDEGWKRHAQGGEAEGAKERDEEV